MNLFDLAIIRGRQSTYGKVRRSSYPRRSLRSACLRQSSAASASAEIIPFAVALYVVAGYWFTASTCFANPAVAIARSMTNTFSGIWPVDSPWFILTEIVGALLAMALFRWLLRPSAPVTAKPSLARRRAQPDS